jgi:hypothetical protein
MSILSQISALFDCEPPIGLSFNKRKYNKDNILGIIVTLLDEDDYKLEIYIKQTEIIIIEYIIDYPYNIESLLEFELEVITLDNILKPLYDKEFILELINAFTNESKELICLTDGHIEGECFLLKLRFIINDDHIDIYKQIQSFPEIYYKRLKYNNIMDMIKIIEYRMLYIGILNSSFEYKIMMDECDIN